MEVFAEPENGHGAEKTVKRGFSERRGSRFLLGCRETYNFCRKAGVGERRHEMTKRGLPGREQILKRMWKLANAGAGDAVRLACFPETEWGELGKLDLDALTEFKRGANGVIELKFADRARLLERLLDAADHSGEEQVDRFLRAMEEKGG